MSLTVQKIISSKETVSIIIIFIIVVSLLAYLKREKIGEKIDSFIIENSKVEEKEKIEIDIES